MTGAFFFIYLLELVDFIGNDGLLFPLRRRVLPTAASGTTLSIYNLSIIYNFKNNPPKPPPPLCDTHTHRLIPLLIILALYKTKKSLSRILLTYDREGVLKIYVQFFFSY